MPSITDADAFSGVDGKGATDHDFANAAETASAGVSFSDSDAGGGTETLIIAIKPSVRTSDAATATDAGEQIVQTGPYPDSDAGSGADASQVQPAGAETGSGAETASVFTAVAVRDGDVSRRPGYVDVDSMQAVDFGYISSGGFSDADTGHGADGK